jgi:hypothetical protein
MRTSMLPLVDVVHSNGLLADKSIDATFATVTDVFDFYSRDLVTDSGHGLMIGETGAALNYSKLGPQPSMANGGSPLLPLKAVLTGCRNARWGNL